MLKAALLLPAASLTAFAAISSVTGVPLLVATFLMPTYQATPGGVPLTTRGLPSLPVTVTSAAVKPVTTSEKVIVIVRPVSPQLDGKSVLIVGAVLSTS